MATLGDLLAAKTADERWEQLRALLNTAGFPVTDWYVGSAARTMLRAFCTAVAEFDALVPQIASGGFIGPIEVGGRALPSRPWLELLAREVYAIDPAPATYTKQRVALWHTVGTGPTTIAIGELTARSIDDNRYTNLTGGVVPAGTAVPVKLYLEFQAESPGERYNRDTAGRIVELVTPQPGLQISNEPPDFGGVNSLGQAVRSGTGTGTVTPVRTSPVAVPTGTRTYTLTITGVGQVLAAAGSLVIRDGVNTSTIVLAPIVASHNIGNGVTLAFANGGQNPSFLAGDVYTFSTPGSPLLNAGTDPESDDSLRARMRGRWPSLSAVPTADKYTAWIYQASIDAGYGVAKSTVRASTVIPGQVEIRVATAAGGVSAPVVAALQAYVDARIGIGDLANVESAVTVSVTAGGTVTIRTRNAATTKAAARTNWELYLAGLPIGGDAPHGVVRLAELQQALMDAGAVDVSGLTLDGIAANLALTGSQVAVVDNAIDTTGVVWVEVP